ncbi:STAS domain-containing protein [Actinoplanes sp. NPDC051346]|uniref:STAS domain-containing protein n=1 Tax=Actinoplanes sp. NPDC051346 TaxID=3155048 RepID=UPI0034236B14
MPRLFAIVAVTADVLTVVVSGELDAANRMIVLDALLDAFSESKPRHVVVDLSALGFCDSAGARVLGCGQQLALSHGASWRICNPQPHVEWLLRIVRPGLFTVATVANSNRGH